MKYWPVKLGFIANNNQSSIIGFRFFDFGPRCCCSLSEISVLLTKNSSFGGCFENFIQVIAFVGFTKFQVFKAGGYSSTKT